MLPWFVKKRAGVIRRDARHLRGQRKRGQRAEQSGATVCVVAVL